MYCFERTTVKWSASIYTLSYEAPWPVYLSEVFTHFKLKTTRKPLTTNKQAKQGKKKKKKNELRSNQDDTTLLEVVSLWHRYKHVWSSS